MSDGDPLQLERPRTSRGRRPLDDPTVVEGFVRPNTSRGRRPDQPASISPSVGSSAHSSDLNDDLSKFADELRIDKTPGKHKNYRMPLSSEVVRSQPDTNRQRSSPFGYSTTVNHSLIQSTSTQPHVKRQSSFIQDGVVNLPTVPSRPGSSKYTVLPGISQSNPENTGSASDFNECRSPATSEKSFNTFSGKSSTPRRPVDSNDNAVYSEAKLSNSGPEGSLNVRAKRGTHSDKQMNSASVVPNNAVEGNASHKVNSVAAERSQPVVKQQQKQQQKSVVQTTSNLNKAEHRQQLCLAIKLPSGKRIQKSFRPTDSLESVMSFAEAEEQTGLSSCEFVRADTRQVLSNLSVTLQKAGLKDRTVLFLQLPEPC